MLARILPLLAGLLLFSAAPAPSLAAGERDSAPSAVDLRLPAPTRATLENGLRVLLMEDHSTPVVAVQVWYHVGSKDERPGKRGLAHMFEHMMFRGTKKHGPGEFDRLLDEVGASNNAFTSEDVTVYIDDAPAEHLDLVLGLEADRMRNLELVQKIIDSEREVVKEEKRLRLDNDPIGKTLETFRALAYTRHPYSWTPAGTLEELDSVTPADAKAFYDTYYQPNNAVLVVVGDFRTKETMARIRKEFGPIPRGPNPPREIAREPPQKEMRTRTLRLSTRFPIMIGGYHIPAMNHPDIAVLEVLAGILSGGQSARMYRSVVREKELAVFAGGSADVMEDPGLFLVFAGFPPDQDPDEVRAALLAEVEAVAKGGVQPRELEKAKNQLTAAHVFGLATVSGKASSLGNAEMLEGGYEKFLEGAEKYERVTAGDVQAAAARHLLRSKLTVVTLLPEAP